MDALFRRLRYYADIGDRELAALKALKGGFEDFASGEDLINRGERPSEAFIVEKGWAARNVTLRDGRSQILNFMLPGDVFDLQVFVADKADHTITAITSVRVFQVERRALLSLFDGGTRAGAAFWWCALQEEAILREQIVRNGRRSARERVAHLILELHRRAIIAGEAEGESFVMPISQALLADALGLSFVHVNRVLRELHHAGCIERNRTILTLKDRARLREIADFDDDYLHIKDNRRRLVYA